MRYPGARVKRDGAIHDGVGFAGSPAAHPHDPSRTALADELGDVVVGEGEGGGRRGRRQLPFAFGSQSGPRGLGHLILVNAAAVASRSGIPGIASQSTTLASAVELGP